MMNALLVLASLAVGGSGAGRRVKVEIFGESLCPYTSRLLHNQLRDLYAQDDVWDRVELEYHAFGNADCWPRGKGDFTCECQHGEDECLVNQVQNCVQSHHGYDPDAYLPALLCLQGTRPARVRRCLRQHGLDQKEILVCASNAKGRRLMAKAGATQANRAPDKEYVPWVLVDGVWHDNGQVRRRGLDGLVCPLLDPQPASCRQDDYAD